MIPIRKHYSTKADKPVSKPSTDFSQGREDWEMAVFRDAVEFTVCYHSRKKGCNPDYNVQRFGIDKLPEAIKACEGFAPNGKEKLLYAVTREGRQLCLDKADHTKWFEIWQQRGAIL